MVTLPPQFVATYFPGYFWNVETRSVWSIKISGVLHELKFTKASYWNHWRSGFRVSHEGNKRWLDMEYLETLKPQPQVIPQKPPRNALPLGQIELPL